MATVFQRQGRPGWYCKYTDATGNRVRCHLPATTKAEATRAAFELERRAEREAIGLEARPTDAGQTLAELCRWWIKNKCPKRSVSMETLRLERHVCSQSLGSLKLHQVTTARIEAALDAMATKGAAPASLNRLRAILSTVFTRARKAKLWTGPNPVTDAERRKVPKRAYETLKADEVARLLPQVEASWRNLFAAALWTGARKGELCGLLKTDVDLEARTLTIARSYDHDSTKGGIAAVVPIAEPLLPYLKDAMERSTSGWVFPAPSGKMRDPECDPQKILKTALKRAGIISGWAHTCRRCKSKGAAENERTQLHQDGDQRRCGACGMKLWARAIPRHVRFHDLRHSAATLMLRAGVDPYRVQRLLRHSSVNVTTGTYGHLIAEDLRGAINTLPPGPAAPTFEPMPLKVAAGGFQALKVGDGVPKRVPRLVSQKESAGPAGFSPTSPAVFSEREKRFELSTPALARSSGAWDPVARQWSAGPIRPPSQGADSPYPDGGEPLSIAGHGIGGAQTGAHTPARLRALESRPGRMLTVADVAEALSVSKATVYALVDRGELPHVRVSNAVRIAPADLEAFIARGRR